jgi:long-chain acyl-CoA synthetase
MTSVNRIFDFPYYQLEKYSSIPDAFVTKKMAFGKNFNGRIYSKANAVSRALCEWVSRKTIKSR